MVLQVQGKGVLLLQGVCQSLEGRQVIHPDPIC